MRTKKNATRNLISIVALVLFIIGLAAFYRGVGWPVLFSFAFLSIVLLVIVGFAGSIVDATAILRQLPEPVDSSEVQRVVTEPSSGREIIVRGSLMMTFREACLNYWDFKMIQKNDNWIITDERGNDITNETLDSHNGLAKIILLGGIARSKSTDGKIAEYAKRTERDYGVTYYD